MLLLAKLFVGLFIFIPRPVCLALARAFGRLMFGAMKERAQVAVDNLALIYGDAMPPKERVRLARENFAHLSEVFFEILHVVARRQRLDKIITVEGLENLQAALGQGRGAVFFSAHLGNFLLMTPPLMKLGNIKFVFRDPAEPKAAEIYTWARNRMGVRVIADNPREKCALQCFKQIRSKGVVGILIDQVENGGVWVDFMGQPAGSTIGAVSVALRTGAPLLPLRCLRLPDRRLKVEIGPEFAVQREGAPEEELITRAVTATNAVVGQWVREHPEQWLWGHRRWRKWRK